LVVNPEKLKKITSQADPFNTSIDVTREVRSPVVGGLINGETPGSQVNINIKPPHRIPKIHLKQE